LASDQAAVNADQAAVARDKAAMSVPFQHLAPEQAIDCAVQSQSPSKTTTTLSEACRGFAGYPRLAARLNADQFKLQGAQDQLNRDESGG
jgi:hypothetical protein